MNCSHSSKKTLKRNRSRKTEVVKNAKEHPPIDSLREIKLDYNRRHGIVYWCFKLNMQRARE